MYHYWINIEFHYILARLICFFNFCKILKNILKGIVHPQKNYILSLITHHLVVPNAEFTLHGFQSCWFTVVFSLHDYLRLHSVAAVLTLHDGSATGGYTLHDFTTGRFTDNSV